jgi:subtilisin family serine protease
VSAFAVAAVDASDPGLDTIQGFSSRGPCSIRVPEKIQREKPDLTGLDGIRHTRPGGFPSPFFGTSAAAPGVAAVAALLAELNPALRGTALGEALIDTAVDLGLPDRDLAFGYGRVDGLAAAVVVAPPDFRSPTPSPTPTPTPVDTATPVPTPTLPPCFGDCDGSGQVSVNELVVAVSISLGTEPLQACPGADVNRDGFVTVDELVLTVNSALVGCSG